MPTVAVPAALGLGRCEVVAGEVAVSHRHGGASRACAASRPSGVRGTNTPLTAAASRLPLNRVRPPDLVGGALAILGGRDSPAPRRARAQDRRWSLRRLFSGTARSIYNVGARETCRPFFFFSGNIFRAILEQV